MPGSKSLFYDMLTEYLPVDEMIYISEGRMGLLSGILSKNGFAALSGTGSDAFMAYDDDEDSVGGWGGLLGDEGSGFDIGRQVLSAVIRANDGWGMDTVLTKKVFEYYGLTKLNGLIPIIYKASDYRSVIAPCAKLAAEAAAEKDAVAVSIYRQAADDMAKQALAVIRRWETKDESYANLPITVCGGAWKGHAEMFTMFAKTIGKNIPSGRLYYPMYETVVGGVVHMLLSAGQQNKIPACLNEFYHDFRYPLPPEWNEDGREQYFKWMA